MSPLTDRQHQVYTFLAGYLDANGYPPTLQEIAKHLHISGNLGVLRHLRALERAGLVTKHRHGKETRLHTSIETVRQAHRLLDELEAMWRSRIERFAQIAEDDHRPTDDKSNRGEANP